MYTPPHNRQPDPAEVVTFMREFPFATLVTNGTGGMVASHIPLSIGENAGGIRLTGHIAKANQQVAHLLAGGEAMAIFSEPHAYVSPDHYEPGNWVPTWNYIAVNAYGVPRVVDTREAKLAVLAESIAVHDPSFAERLAGYPPEFVDAKLKGLVAFELEVTRCEARWKLSQDRQPAEQERIALALTLSSDPSARRLADYMTTKVGA